MQEARRDALRFVYQREICLSGTDVAVEDALESIDNIGAQRQLPLREILDNCQVNEEDIEVVGVGREVVETKLPRGHCHVIGLVRSSERTALCHNL